MTTPSQAVWESPLFVDWFGAPFSASHFADLADETDQDAHALLRAIGGKHASLVPTSVEERVAATLGVAKSTLSPAHYARITSSLDAVQSTYATARNAALTAATNVAEATISQHLPAYSAATSALDNVRSGVAFLTASVDVVPAAAPAVTALRMAIAYLIGILNNPAAGALSSVVADGYAPVRHLVLAALNDASKLADSLPVHAASAERVAEVRAARCLQASAAHCAALFFSLPPSLPGTSI
eukprot:1647365-Prymnesium_polylepis.1